ncbi:hypothetical protein ARAM_001822 [Aspergillus rambellii]|uniref:Xylanolytic transcriptional activator regulatory domain-containing protein n=1 Tax=Aspergillus rambellii TaxID=308745 RepID=A0A0F8WHK1_9EURO|nr:hypothetical protein ARAM_001822 [Aspergillus rambellii]
MRVTRASERRSNAIKPGQPASGARFKAYNALLIASGRTTRPRSTRPGRLSSPLHGILPLSQDDAEEATSSPAQSTSIATPELGRVMQSQPSPPGPATLGQLHLSSQIPNSFRAFSGLPFFSSQGQQWIGDRTGQHVDLYRFYCYGPPWQSQRVARTEDMYAYFRAHDHLDLPHPNLLHEYLHKFRTSYRRVMFPVIELEGFQYTIQAAYEHKTTHYSPDIHGARACIFAFMAFMAIPERQSTMAEQYTYEAMFLVPGILQGMASIDAVQTLLTLTCSRLFLYGDAFSVDIMLSAAARFLFNLGGNIPTRTTSLFALRCRTLFWTIYTIDKELCFRTGRPPSLCDDQCDLTLPDETEYANQVGYGILPKPGPDHLHIAFPTDLRIAIIKSRIYTRLWSVPAQFKSDAELLQTIRELDVAVEEWKVHLPTVEDPVVLNPEMADDFDMRHRFWLLNFQYQYCVAAIHQTTTGCAAWIRDENQQLPGITSSLAVAVAASRSLLDILMDRRFSLEMGSFWFDSFYIISGVITLFCNILKNPLAPTVGNDISYFHMIARRIEEIRDPAEFQADRGRTREFVVELCRLAECAVHFAHQYGSESP